MHMGIYERNLLRILARDICNSQRNPLIVNIGVAATYGHCSMRCLLAGMTGGKLIGIDIADQGEMPSDFPGNVEILIGNSPDVVANFDTIHLAFVDGDHTEEGVEADIKALWAKIPPGGIIAFHDYNRPRTQGFAHVMGVSRAVDRLMENKRWKYLYDIDSIRVFMRK